MPSAAVKAKEKAKACRQIGRQGALVGEAASVRASTLLVADRVRAEGSKVQRHIECCAPLRQQ